MLRRLGVSALLFIGSAVLAVLPSSPASATTFLCEGVGYEGVTSVGVGPVCVPNPLNTVPDCSTGFLTVPLVGTVWDEVCVPPV